jgi:hypothetical protein
MGLYMFRALLAHPQEVLHKQRLVYSVRIMSVGCGSENVGLGFPKLFGHEILFSLKYTDGVQRELENDTEEQNKSKFYTEKFPYT